MTAARKRERAARRSASGTVIGTAATVMAIGAVDGIGKTAIAPNETATATAAKSQRGKTKTERRRKKRRGKRRRIAATKTVRRTGNQAGGAAGETSAIESATVAKTRSGPKRRRGTELRRGKESQTSPSPQLNLRHLCLLLLAT